MTKLYITISVLIVLLISTVFIFLTREYNYLQDYNEKVKELQEAEQKHLEQSLEMIENYNILYADYNRLYRDYRRLWVNLSDSGWTEFICTGYSANDGSQGTGNIVATGFDLEKIKDIPIIAVDPDVIPLYSIVEIEGLGAFLSLDTGGFIKGNRIDIYFESKDKAINFGRQTLWCRVIK